MRVWARWVQGLIIKLMNFFATLKMLKKEEKRDLKRKYSHCHFSLLGFDCNYSNCLMTFLFFSVF